MTGQLGNLLLAVGLIGGACVAVTLAVGGFMTWWSDNGEGDGRDASE